MLRDDCSYGDPEFCGIIQEYLSCHWTRGCVLCHHLVVTCLIAGPCPHHRICITQTVVKSSFFPLLLLPICSLEAFQALAEGLVSRTCQGDGVEMERYTSSFDFQIRLRCQKGIPPSLRGRAWQYLSGGKVKLQQNPGKFDVSEFSFFTSPSFRISVMGVFPWQLSFMLLPGLQQDEGASIQAMTADSIVYTKLYP